LPSFLTRKRLTPGLKKVRPELRSSASRQVKKQKQAPQVSTSVARIGATDVAEPEDVTTLARINSAAAYQAQATGRSGRRPCPGYLSRRSTAMLA